MPNNCHLGIPTGSPHSPHLVPSRLRHRGQLLPLRAQQRLRRLCAEDQGRAAAANGAAATAPRETRRRGRRRDRREAPRGERPDPTRGVPRSAEECRRCRGCGEAVGKPSFSGVEWNLVRSVGWKNGVYRELRRGGNTCGVFCFWWGHVGQRNEALSLGCVNTPWKKERVTASSQPITLLQGGFFMLLPALQHRRTEGTDATRSSTTLRCKMAATGSSMAASLGSPTAWRYVTLPRARSRDLNRSGRSTVP